MREIRQQRGRPETQGLRDARDCLLRGGVGLTTGTLFFDLSGYLALGSGGVRPTGTRVFDLARSLARGSEVVRTTGTLFLPVNLARSCRVVRPTGTGPLP